MHIEAIRNIQYSPSMKEVYFTKSSWIFLKDKSSWAGETIAKTSKGTEYLADTTIPESLKARFKQIPFIQSLARNNDVFIHYKEFPKGFEEVVGHNNMASAKIIWADYKKAFADFIFAGGVSSNSQEEATENLLKNLEQKNISSEIPCLQKVYV